MVFNMIQYFVALLLVSLARAANTTTTKTTTISTTKTTTTTTTTNTSTSGLTPICGGCIRYVKGFDITGVTDTVQYTFKNNNITNACDCFNKCRNHPNRCASWVWKFTGEGGHRTCTVYSNFNLPPAVTIGFKLNTSVHIGVIAGGSPQVGGLVPRCKLFDEYGNATGVDNNCVSGPLWALDNKKFLC